MTELLWLKCSFSYWIKHHTVKICGNGGGVWSPFSLKFVVSYGSELSASSPGHLTPNERSPGTDGIVGRYCVLWLNWWSSCSFSAARHEIVAEDASVLGSSVATFWLQLTKFRMIRQPSFQGQAAGILKKGATQAFETSENVTPNNMAVHPRSHDSSFNDFVTKFFAFVMEGIFIYLFAVNSQLIYHEAA